LFNIRIICRFAPRLEITTINTVEKMSRVCELTGKKAMVGNNVSHALNRTKRKFDANLMTKRFFIPEEDKWITLKVSASALKNINKKGISAVIKEARANGFLTK
jgi:large subunit ribosomal protein L28